jgi:hypothetical protein
VAVRLFQKPNLAARVAKRGGPVKAARASNTSDLFFFRQVEHYAAHWLLR